MGITSPWSGTKTSLLNKVMSSMSAFERLTPKIWQKIFYWELYHGGGEHWICLLPLNPTKKLLCEVAESPIVVPIAYWISIIQTTCLSTLVSHFIEKTSRMSWPYKNYFPDMSDHPQSFWVKGKITSKSTKSPGLGQKLRYPNLDKIRSNTRKSVKIIRWIMWILHLL